MNCNLDEEVKKNPHNYPYIAMVTGDASLQFFQIAERIVVCKSEGFMGALIDLVLLFIQRYIMDIR